MFFLDKAHLPFNGEAVELSHVVLVLVQGGVEGEGVGVGDGDGGAAAAHGHGGGP